MSNSHGRRGIMVLCPRRFCHKGVTEITIDELKSAGVENVLLDLDNTIVAWQGMDIPAEIRKWLIDLKEAGFKMCLVSNTRHGKRLIALSEELEIPYVKRAFKPRKKGFMDAMQDLGADASKTVMIGDQMFTDILGGNRLGIFTIMVKPMHNKEFFGTKVTRSVEVILMAWFRKRGVLPRKGED